jgi:thiol-disulfide isomerase/thioredoxin
MLTMNPGPLAAPIALALLIFALLIATGVGRVSGRRQQTGIGNVLIDMLIAAVLVARIAFVALWFDTYRSTPWAMLDIRDGGFTLWAGVVAAWQGWRRAALRKPLTFGLAAGCLAWGAMFGAVFMMENSALPKVSLTTLAGKPTDLAALAAGNPLVVNLWATWCPPCRREMPVLAAAQKRETDVSFVFVNQGENGTTAQRYLTAAGLDIANVVLDPGAAIGREVGSMGLPTTLFYDANGRLVDTHVGELSAASLASKLSRLRSRPRELAHLATALYDKIEHI